ncbi:hypothetical protein Plhal304r1_c024g0081891 [Plasmopara halstedii]
MIEAKDANTRSLGVYGIGPPATTQVDLEKQKAFQARFLVPQEILVDTYRTQLRVQRKGALVPAMRTIPVVLAPGEATEVDRRLFERWVQRPQKFYSLYRLQLNHKEIDARVESHHRFEFAKLKARFRLPSDCRLVVYELIPPASAEVSTRMSWRPQHLTAIT